MKSMFRNLLCLALALMLAISVFPAAFASEAINGQVSKDGYTIVSVQYAYNEGGAVHLYDETGETIVATIGNGAKLAVTDEQQNGRTFVQFGATSGWIDNGDLYLQLPQHVTGQVTGSSAPANQLTPIQTTPPKVEADSEDGAETDEAVDVEDDTESEPADEPEDSEEPEEPTETVGDPEKDHEPIAAMYEEEASDAVAVDVVQLGVVTSIILLEEERVEVDTALLSFGEEIPEEQKLGYVHAPRTGQAGLRETPAKDGKVITQLKAGQLVAVLALEEDYAHVNVQGVEGWLRLDCLKYLQAAEDGIVSSADLAPLGIQSGAKTEAATEESAADGSEDAKAQETNESADQAASSNDTNDSEDEQTELVVTGNMDNNDIQQPVEYPAKAQLSCKGETDGTTSVNLRNLPTKDSAKTAVWRTGVEVTVLSYQGGWYLVEADGVCGYVMEAFLEMEG